MVEPLDAHWTHRIELSEREEAYESQIVLGIRPRVRFPRPPDVALSPYGISWHLLALLDRTKFSE
jgi:hypothetical protein